ncbi:PREDICTED: uncharacterized protein LOC100634390 [Amphimedon queenslandica]|uniref:IRS-type PTB domain-containing protein n=1 Tax=Amphimedon queenslandica TaxID=400682 RepID=A0A1X7VCM6_AMPQE|nr:PREDICTED: uncharacterized protein LOC100634390 [Amphimedon queenslandica]|eukprot:XP_003385005.1 PREDICTED: uncharacterized protein LOC100634390 [Amphimedon queenslandica]
MSTSTHDGPKLNVDDLLFFPGKELNETNIAGRRSPPQPIRLAIGRHGVYKFERDKDKVLAFWGFQELSDWSFSGYSFTLNFINRKVYHLRTDDGQAISHWIDSFSKNPDQASVRGREGGKKGKREVRKREAIEK